MCGICGSSESETSAIRAMNAAMVHRGPDDEGVYVDPEAGVALGARRLSIIDIEGGHQPLSNEDGRVWAVLNGEIYNHPSLRLHLLERGHAFSSATDTEVLVHLYEDYGQDLVHALEGMYAFAIWDSERRLLLVGRDRFGEKPLFYLLRGHRLTFASELKALLAGLRIAWDIDPAALDAYFVWGYVPDPLSLVPGIRQLEPGHMLVWDHGRRSAALRCYWSPPENPPAEGASIADLVGEARLLLERSVQSRLISDVPVGVFLSGGVDSSLVAALSARHSPHPIKTFSVGFDTGSVNETPAARRVASLLGAEHRELVVTEREIASRVPSLIRELDQPLADKALVPLRLLAEFARPEVTVAVGGEGADEAFGGYPRYRWLARAARFHAWAPAQGATRVADLLGAIPGPGRARRLCDVVTPVSTAQRHINWVTAGRAGLRRIIYGPRLQALGDSAHFADRLEDILGGQLDGAVESMFMRLDQLHWLPGDVLAKADRATMRASLEFRTPYLSREVAEFAASVPASVHVRNGGKMLLRRMLQETLPLATHRRKVAFRTPAASWLRGPLWPVLSEQLRSGSLFSEGWFERSPAASYANEHREGHADWSNVLWPLLVLGVWLDDLAGVARDQ
jgi:asparagine synthase (glutamine-hydrolysing)